MSVWQQWIRHPERVWARRALFQIHLWVGAGAGLYIVLMSITGSLIVWRNELERKSSLTPTVEWVVRLHENLLFGENGRTVNGVGAICAILLCLTGAVIWWPGVDHWRRALTVSWREPFARLSWDLHSALGFWAFVALLLWGISGLYFVFPQPFNSALGSVDPADKFADKKTVVAQPAPFWQVRLVFRGALGFGRAGASSAVGDRRVSVLPPDDP